MTTIYYNPNCSKCRETLEILGDKGEDPTIVEYLNEPPTEQTLQDVLRKLGLRPKDIIRTKEATFKGLNLDLENDAAVLQALVKNPILLERPIVIKGDKAAVCRPAQNVLKIL